MFLFVCLPSKHRDIKREQSDMSHFEISWILTWTEVAVDIGISERGHKVSDRDKPVSYQDRTALVPRCINAAARQNMKQVRRTYT